MSKKYESLANEIIEKVGGVENVDQLTHCMTRLRFTLKDMGKASVENVKAIEGVINVTVGGGQFQVVIGTHVAEVFEEMPDFSGGTTTSTEGGTQEKKKWHEKVLDVISGSFSPVIPAIAGTGMLKAVLVLLTSFGWLSQDSQMYYILSYIGDTAFYFLPFLLAWSISVKMKTSTVLSMLMAALMSRS